VKIFGLHNFVSVENIWPIPMDRFHDGANKELEPQLDFQNFKTLYFIDRT
jgi:hypothetical protein